MCLCNLKEIPGNLPSIHEYDFILRETIEVITYVSEYVLWGSLVGSMWHRQTQKADITEACAQQWEQRTWCLWDFSLVGHDSLVICDIVVRFCKLSITLASYLWRKDHSGKDHWPCDWEKKKVLSVCFSCVYGWCRPPDPHQLNHTGPPKKRTCHCSHV